MAARPYYGAGGYTRDTEASANEGEGRKRKTGTRRTVDYGCTNAKWLAERLCQRSEFDEKCIRPNINEVINVYRYEALANGRCFQPLLTGTTRRPPWP
jgi:hypothetical protein